MKRPCNMVSASGVNKRAGSMAVVVSAVYMFLSVFCLTDSTAAPFAYIANQSSNNISVIDVATNTVTATITGIDGPVGVAVKPDGTRVYVSAAGSTLKVIDVATNTVVATVNLVTGGYGLAVKPDGSRVYVACNDNVAVVNTADNTVVTNIPVLSSSKGVAVSPDGSKVYVSHERIAPNISVIDTATNTVTAATGDGMFGIAVKPDGTRVYAANPDNGAHKVSVIDTSTDTEIAAVPVNKASALAIHPDGSKVYATSGDGGGDYVKVIDTATNTVTATTNLPSCGSYNCHHGISVTPDGSKVYVTNFNVNNVSVINTATNAIDATVTVGAYPISFGQFITPEVCTQPPSDLISWWGGDNNALDMVGANNGTLMNGVTYASGMVGQAFSFNGTDQHVEAPGTVGDFGSAAFSVDFWMYTSDTDATRGHYILGKSNPDAGQGWDIRFYNSTITVEGWSFEITSSITLNTWHHIAVSATVSDITLYIDGVVKGTSGRSVAITSTANPFRIGYTTGFWPYTNIGFNGLIDEVEIFSRALSAEEIAAIYNAGSAGKCRACTPPPSSMISWWKGEDNAEDIVGGNNGTAQAGASYALGRVGKAFSFNGNVDSFVEIADHPSLNPSGSFTIDGWFYIDPSTMTGGKTDAVLASKTNGSVSDGGWQLVFVTGRSGWTNALRFLVMGGGQYPSAILDNAVASAGWHHVAGVYDAQTPGILTLYLNGALVASDSSGVTMVNNGRNVRIGASYWSDTDRLNGKADEVEFFNRALTANEIAAIYNAGCAGKCAHTIGTNTPANGSIACDTVVAQGHDATCTITPETGYYLSGLTDNLANVLGSVSGGTYTISNVTGMHDVVATFAEYPVRRFSGSPIGYYMTIQNAYNNAVEGEEIRARDTVFTGDLTLNLGIGVTLKGGYVSGFATNTGVTTVAGSVTFGGGPVTLESIVVQ